MHLFSMFDVHLEGPSGSMKTLLYHEQIGGTCWLYSTLDVYEIHAHSICRRQKANMDDLVEQLKYKLTKTCNNYGGRIEHALLYLFEGYEMISQQEVAEIQCFIQNVGPVVVSGKLETEDHWTEKEYL